jgi:hypothetical protein
MTKVKVIERFKDAFKTPDTFYEVGQVVEFADEARVKILVSKRLVEVIDETPLAPPPPVMVTVFGQEFDKAVVLEAMGTIGVSTIEAIAEALGDEKKAALKVALGIVEETDHNETEGDETGEENVELIDGSVIGIVKNPDGTQTAFGEDNGEKVPLASGEYRSATHIYTVGDAGTVSVAEITDPEKEKVVEAPKPKPRAKRQPKAEKPE